ncbi:MAG TPA: zinc-dependent metalloprotease, partial [Pirellulaceae bacterium]|nr:zinc-dependent metalloprotease [Pirellulaceae bacterium]
MSQYRRIVRLFSVCALVALGFCPGIRAQENGADPEYPPLDKVIKGYEEIKFLSEDGSEATPFYRVWIDRKNNQLLAELPRDFAADNHRQFVATTLASGHVFAGLQSADYYVYWRQYGKRLAMIAEDLSIRGSDDESKASVKRLFTDRVLVDVPILTVVPRGGPVIDLDELLVNNSSVFFPGVRAAKPQLTRVVTAKTFPENIEIAVEVTADGGGLRTLHYSISKIKGTPSFKPRVADERVGYFTTTYDDFGKYSGDTTRIRYVNRWHLEKRDPSLKVSPPKQPIVFYIEHTTPVRYRRWVREGVLHWNKAFEQVGIINAIEVRQQDKQTGEHMNKDPEDVRYNFIRWLNNNISTAIGPSRVNPQTGEILDADIVLTDGWIRAFEEEFDKVMPRVAMDGMTAETIAWFWDHPDWDPRLRLASPENRTVLRQAIMRESDWYRATFGSTENNALTALHIDPALNPLSRSIPENRACFAAEGRQFDVAIKRMLMAMLPDDSTPTDEQILDGMPESFIGPLLADLVCHEVGHTLGLRHNFKASSIYSMSEINSSELKGQRPFAGSVMDYLPVNYNFELGEVQGDYSMIGVGPYDMWAIEYGYTLDDKQLPEILKRVADPQLVYATDEDTTGPDPLARRYDFGKDPLNYARSQVKLAQHHRGHILEKFVKDGESWAKARRGYQLTLNLQARATSMMANWLGGAFINRDKKGDPDGRRPVEVVPAADQRDALSFVLDNTFQDAAFGLTPDLQAHLVADSWRDGAGGFGGTMSESAWPVHDQILGIQATALSQLMNPTTLRRVFDNEFRVAADQDVLTLPELMNAVTQAVWTEYFGDFAGTYSDRQPAVSSLRRNLQYEHLNRLFDLSNAGKSGPTAMKPISNLATMTLRDLHEQLGKAREVAG